MFKLIQIATLAIVMLFSAVTNGSKINAKKRDRTKSIEVAEISSEPDGTIKSEYTPLDSNSCEEVNLFDEEIEELNDTRQPCPGYNNIPVFVDRFDGRYYVNIGGTDKSGGVGLAYTRLGKKLEWRLRDDVAFAVIYRYYFDSTFERPIVSSVLVVKKVSGKMGSCIAGVIDGNLSNANEVARRFADEKVADFRCGVDSREEISSQVLPTS